MADKKISELTALTGADTANDDQLVIVDTSAGLTKNITMSEFKNALDTATGFVRITGDTMTGDLNVLANVGIGTSSPSYAIDTLSSGAIVAQFKRNAAGGASGGIRFGNNDKQFTLYGDNSNGLSIYDGSTERMRIDASGNVGIGTSSPSSKLELVGSGFTDSTIRLQRTDSGENNDAGLQFTANAGANSGHGMGGIWFKNSLDSNAYALIRARTDDATGTSGRLDFITSTSSVGNTTAPSMRIDSSGNVGIGVSPSSTLDISAAANTTPLEINAATDGYNYSTIRNAAGNDVGYFGIGSALVPSGSADDFVLRAQRNDLVFMSGGNLERMRLDSSGNVGIGTSDPHDSGVNFSMLTLNGAKGGGIVFSDNDVNQYQIYTTDDASLRFSRGANLDSESMRLDASGNLLVGKTAAGIANTGSEFSSTGRAFFTFDGGGPLQLNRKTSDGDIIELHKDGTEVGSIASRAGVVTSLILDPRSGGGGLTGGGAALYPTDNAGAPSDGALTLGDGSSRFKDLHLSGDVYVNTDPTAAYPKNGHMLRGSDSAVFSRDSTGETMQVRRNTTNGHFIRFYKGASTIVGDISLSGSSTAYNTSSDYRLKTDAQPMTGATDRLKQLNPVNFEWIADGTRVDGFLAHEAQAVVPESVTGVKDAMRDEEYEVTPAVTDDDGNVTTKAVMGTRSVPDYQGIDQSKLVPLLVATIQELEARITALENA